jgi:hypothetical protein
MLAIYQIRENCTINQYINCSRIVFKLFQAVEKSRITVNGRTISTQGRNIQESG